jgi:hypothetical protein
VTLSTAVVLPTMSTDPVSEPLRRTDDDLLQRLAVTDHRLHQTSTTTGKLLSQLDEIRANLETPIASPGSAGPIVADAARELPSCREHTVTARKVRAALRWCAQLLAGECGHHPRSSLR